MKNSIGMIAAFTLSTAWAGDFSPRALERAMDGLAPAKSECCVAEEVPGCSKTVEKYCDELYSNENKGNSSTKTSKGTIEQRFGDLPNGFNAAEYEYQLAKLSHADRFPADFKAALDGKSYFEKLKSLLTSRTQAPKARLEWLKMNRQIAEVARIYNETMTEVVLARTERLHPGYDKADPAPVQWSNDNARLENELSVELYRAIWAGSPGWQKVEKEFSAIRAAYLEELKEMKGITEDVRKDWIARISSVELEIPGTNPDRVDHECASVEKNAFYSTTRNKMVVCGGIFNATEFGAILGHELSHALDIDRSKRVFMAQTPLWSRLSGFSKAICSAEKPACPAGWKETRAQFQPLAQALDGFRPQVPQYLSCLQYRKITHVASPKSIKEIAETRANEIFGDLADEGKLLLLASPEIVKSDGTKEPNPNYLNPCGKDGFSEQKMFLSDVGETLFALEYLCDSSETSPAGKVTKAGNSAIALQALLLEKSIPMGGAFSDSGTLAANGLAEDPSERFADGMGYRVFARYLKKNVAAEDRMKVYLANTAFFCDKPSLEREHPEVTQAQKEFSFEPHSDGKQRRLETLVPEIRAAVGCKKDFPGKDCAL